MVMPPSRPPTRAEIIRDISTFSLSRHSTHRTMTATVTGLVKISISFSPLPFLFSSWLLAPPFSLLPDTKRHGFCLLVHRLQEKPCRLTKRLCDCGAYWHYHTIRFVLYQQKFFPSLAIVCALLQLFIVALAHCSKKFPVFLSFFIHFFILCNLHSF